MRTRVRDVEVFLPARASVVTFQYIRRTSMLNPDKWSNLYALSKAFSFVACSSMSSRRWLTIGTNVSWDERKTSTYLVAFSVRCTIFPFLRPRHPSALLHNVGDMSVSFSPNQLTTVSEDNILFPIISPTISPEDSLPDLLSSALNRLLPGGPALRHSQFTLADEDVDGTLAR